MYLAAGMCFGLAEVDDGGFSGPKLFGAVFEVAPEARPAMSSDANEDISQKSGGGWREEEGARSSNVAEAKRLVSDR
eukprot:5164599-Alexandrium_andersonii.AAC.1